MDYQFGIQTHPRLAKLVEGGSILRFKRLPVTAQDALIHYMSVDGAAWAVADGWEDWRWGEGQPYEEQMRKESLSDIARLRHRFIEQYGAQEFGYVVIPWKDLLNAVNGDEDATAEGYVYENASPKLGDWEYDIPTWPVILSSFHRETLRDGWSRFGMYCKLGMNVPAVWYLD